MSIADNIVTLVDDQRKPRTSKGIAALLFATDSGYPQRVDDHLRQLVESGRVERISGGAELLVLTSIGLSHYSPSHESLGRSVG
jgi:hypothetical protein